MPGYSPGDVLYTPLDQGAGGKIHGGTFTLQSPMGMWATGQYITNHTKYYTPVSGNVPYEDAVPGVPEGAVYNKYVAKWGKLQGETDFYSN